MKEFIKKYNICFLFAFIVFIIIINTFLHSLQPLDELWNFQNVYKMFNGYTIYKDANVIVTPIFFIIGNFLFNIFGATINTFRLYNVCLHASQYILIFYIFKSLSVNKNLSILYVSLMLSHFYPTVAGGANYNILAKIFVLIGIILYLKSYNKKEYNTYQGIIIFLVFFTKQNLGVFYALGIVLFELADKKLSKTFILNQVKKFIFFTLPTFLSCLIMYKKGNFFDFINYVFGGLFDFGNSNIYVDLGPFMLFMFIVITIVVLYYFSTKRVNLLSYEVKRHLTFILIVSICMSFTILPIINRSHLTFAYTLLYILLFYILDTVFISHIFTTENYFKMSNYCCILFLSIIVLHIVSVVYPNFKLFGKFDSTHPYYNSPIEQETLEKINFVSKYIKEKNNNDIDVVILSSDAAYVMIYLKQSHGAFDLAFKGNLGYNGVERMITEIQDSKNTEFLIYTDEADMFWQESLEIRNYIINNLQKTGEISNYSIFSK